MSLLNPTISPRLSAAEYGRQRGGSQVLSIIVAIFVALSLVGGGVVYAAENAPPTSPLHPVQVAVNTASGSLHLIAPSTISSGPVTAPRQDSGKLNATSTPPAAKDENGPKPTMTPLPPDVATAVAAMESDVKMLATDTAVPGHDGNGPENGLDAKLNAAVAALGRGDHQTAASNLDAFVHQLNALERSNHISQTDYTNLYSQYLALLQKVDPTATPVSTVTPNAEGHGSNQGATHSNATKHDDAADSSASETSTTSSPTATPTLFSHGNGIGNGIGARVHGK